MVEVVELSNCGCSYTLSASTGMKTLSFVMPSLLEAGEPPEARGLSRDQVRLMVSHYRDDRLFHSSFRELSRFLEAGDVLVINTSGTMNAALNAVRADGMPLELHLSTRLPADLWSVEVRQFSDGTTKPFQEIEPGERLRLAAGGQVTLHTPHSSQQRSAGRPARLWIATLSLPVSLSDYLAQYGFPIRYSYVKDLWPLDYYQTVYATEAGSAEMPSAGRAFSAGLITQLVAKGVQFAPLILHTGVASLEDHEPPYEEFYRVPAATAQVINVARAAGRRVIAVGTTTVRALETASDEGGKISPSKGWTNLIVTPERRICAVDGMLTGFHEPRATHLAMLESLVGLDHLCLAYQEALRHRYLWHEFGDLHLILP